MDTTQHTLIKFDNPVVTLKGEPRARAPFLGMKTLWFNTGTLCNIECKNCYIESSPHNDRLVYLTRDDVKPYLDELEEMSSGPIEIGFTGGEPFMAPEIIDILEETLSRGHEALILTNAMAPLMRPRVRKGLEKLGETYKDKITFRVSLDHFTADKHDEERGKGGFDSTLRGMNWLSENGFKLAVAGRTLWHEAESEGRNGYADLFAEHGFVIDANDPMALVLFPEMENASDPPEITTACWSILSVNPADMMCASQRMVVKRKHADKPVVLPCTLLPYDRRFEMGDTLKQARDDVPLNHPYCATFCVLGGGSCSA